MEEISPLPSHVLPPHDFDITTEIVNALRKKSLSSELRRDEPLVTFGLNITADRSIVIKNRNIDVLLSTNLRITGTDIAPIVSGQDQGPTGQVCLQTEL